MLRPLLEGFNNKRMKIKPDHVPWKPCNVQVEVNGSVVSLEKTLVDAVPYVLMIIILPLQKPCIRFGARVVVRGPSSSRTSGGKIVNLFVFIFLSTLSILAGALTPPLPSQDLPLQTNGKKHRTQPSQLKSGGAATEEKEEDDEEESGENDGQSMHETLQMYERRIKRIDTALVDALNSKAQNDVIDALKHKLHKYEKKRRKLKVRIHEWHEWIVVGKAKSALADDRSSMTSLTDDRSSVTSLAEDARNSSVDDSKTTPIYPPYSATRSKRETNHWSKAVRLTANRASRHDATFGDWTAGTVSSPNLQEGLEDDEDDDETEVLANSITTVKRTAMQQKSTDEVSKHRESQNSHANNMDRDAGADLEANGKANQNALANRSEATVAESAVIVLDKNYWLRGLSAHNAISRRREDRNKFADGITQVMRSKRSHGAMSLTTPAGVRWSAWRVRQKTMKDDTRALERAGVVKGRLRALVGTTAWRGFELRGGFVSPPAALECETIDALGEVGDAMRGTHRLTKPEVRRCFVKRVVEMYLNHIAVQSRRGLRYVGLGSGLCLVDFEILACLAQRGVTATSIVLVDPLYGGVFDDFVSHDSDEEEERYTDFSLSTVGSRCSTSSAQRIAEEEREQKHRRLMALRESLDMLWTRDSGHKTATTRKLLSRESVAALGQHALLEVGISTRASRVSPANGGTTSIEGSRYGLCGDDSDDDSAARKDEATLKRCAEALKQLAEFCSPGCKQFLVLSSLEELEAAAIERPDVFGEATLVVSCDATLKRCLHAHHENAEPLGCGIEKVHARDAMKAIVDPDGPAIVATLEDTTSDVTQRAVRLLCDAVEHAVETADEMQRGEEQRAMFEVECYWAQARVGLSQTTIELWRPSAAPEPLQAAMRDERWLEEARRMRLAKATYWRNRVQRDEVRDLEEDDKGGDPPKTRFLCVSLPLSNETMSAEVAPLHSSDGDVSPTNDTKAPFMRVLFAKGAERPLGSPMLPTDKLNRGSSRPADLNALFLTPAELSSLPPLVDGTELVVEVPLDFQGGWANVSPGSYWWRETLASLATLGSDDAEVRNEVANVVADDTCAWILVEGPGCRPLKAVHSLGAIVRRGLAIDSPLVEELSPGEIVEIIETRITNCTKRLKRCKIATLLVRHRRKPVFGWLSAKTLDDIPPMRRVPAFLPRDHNLYECAPDEDAMPIPPVDQVPESILTVPPRYKPGDTMTVQIGRLSTEPKSDTKLNFTVTIPNTAKPGEQFRVKTLSPLLDSGFDYL